MTSRAAVLLLLAPWSGAAAAQGIEFDDTVVETVEAGIFCTDPTGERMEAPGTVSGFIDLVDRSELRAETLVVPVSQGVTFGYRVTPVGGSGDRDVVHRLTHPPFGGSGATRQDSVGVLFGEGPTIRLYSFDYGYEMVEGRWTMMLGEGDGPLVRVTFEAVPAAEAPQFVGLCEGDPTISRGLPPDRGLTPARKRASQGEREPIAIRTGTSTSHPPRPEGAAPPSGP